MASLKEILNLDKAREEETKITNKWIRPDGFFLQNLTVVSFQTPSTQQQAGTISVLCWVRRLDLYRYGTCASLWRVSTGLMLSSKCTLIPNAVPFCFPSKRSMLESILKNVR